MAEFIKDKRLLDGRYLPPTTCRLTFLLTSPLSPGFTPKWSIGCRRVTPRDPYMLAIQKPNVDVHFTEVTQITEDGVIGADGLERKVIRPSLPLPSNPPNHP